MNGGLKTALVKALREEGPTLARKGRQKYHIRIVEPDPDVDHLIVEIEPDPKVDYRIRIFDPVTRREESRLHREVSEEILRQLRKRDNSRMDDGEQQKEDEIRSKRTFR